MGKNVLVFGGDGMVGSRFIELNRNAFKFTSPSQSEINLLNQDQVFSAVTGSDAEVVVNFAAFTNVGKAEEEKGNKDGLVYKLNAEAVKHLAQACQEAKKYLIQISTEYVFDGNKTVGLNSEEDKPNPHTWYGFTKYMGEQMVQEENGSFGIVRISMPYRAHFEGKKDIARRFLEMLKEGQDIKGITDAVNTVTFIDDIVEGLRLIIERQYQGIIHLAAADSTSPYAFARLIAQKFQLDESLVKPISFTEYCKSANGALLKNSGLETSGFRKEFSEGVLHTVEEGVAIFKKQIDSVG